MLRVFAVSLLMTGTFLVADEPGSAILAAPAGWGGETIGLPPGFAPDMKLKGSEHIRFAPGMMKPESDSFFCYAFVFELQPEPVLTQAVIKAEFLKYYRGLCKAVLKETLPDVDPSAFTFQLQRVNSDAKRATGEEDADTPTQNGLYIGRLDWVEPFATAKSQVLHFEIQAWTDPKTERGYLFVGTSPQEVSDATAIWKEMRRIRSEFKVEATATK